MQLESTLYLMLTRGLLRETVRTIALETAAASRAASWNDVAVLADLRRRAAACARGTTLHWPEPAAVTALADRLRNCGARLLWRGEPEYPERLHALRTPPPWLWLCGKAARLRASTCAMVGSRRTPPLLAEVARRLARALADAGVCVASGMAAGADSAAHEGAEAGRAGTIAIPARGLLGALERIGLRRDGWTVLALETPDEPFSAALAVRRNALIAAMGDGLILVASELKGGSSYAVRWALDSGRPLWCLDAGRATPPANQQLLRAGRAQPLPIDASADEWLGAILPRLQTHTPPVEVYQPDLLGEQNA